MVWVHPKMAKTVSSTIGALVVLVHSNLNNKLLGPIIMTNQLETCIKTYITFITLFFRMCVRLLCPLPSNTNIVIMLSQNHFLKSNQDILIFLYLIE